MDVFIKTRGLFVYPSSSTASTSLEEGGIVTFQYLFTVYTLFLPSLRIIKGLLYRLLTRDLLPTGITHFSELLANYPAETEREGNVHTAISGLPMGPGSADTC